MAIYLTAVRWHTVTVSPIIRGAIPLLSGFPASQAPQTTMTRIKARKNSIPKPCTGVILVRLTDPSLLSWKVASAESALKIADPVIAPTHCDIM